MWSGVYHQSTHAQAKTSVTYLLSIEPQLPLSPHRCIAQHLLNRGLFERLPEWEDAHYDLIQAELDSINHTGMWLGMPEFRMDGKY
jgi:hypothetical protein